MTTDAPQEPRAQRAMNVAATVGADIAYNAQRNGNAAWTAFTTGVETGLELAYRDPYLAASIRAFFADMPAGATRARDIVVEMMLNA